MTSKVVKNANPYKWWQSPSQWKRWRRIQGLHRDYGSVRVDLNEWEVRYLVPLLRDRAQYMLKVFSDLKAVCQDPDLPRHLAPSLKEVWPPLLAGGNEGLAQKVKVFLTEAETMMDTNFMVPLRRISLNQAEITSVSQLLDLIQDMHLVCESVMVVEDNLFRARFRTHVLVTNETTGEAMIREPKQILLTLSPFQNALIDLRRVAEGTEGTIKHWQEQIQASRKPFLEFLAANTNANTSRRTIVIQILAMALALSFSTFFMTARDPFGLKKENTALKAQLEEARMALSKACAPTP
jgi:hypothetical protein